MQIISNNPDQKNAVVELGFEKLFHLPGITIRQELMTFLISAFDCNSSSLCIPNKREIEIDAADAHVLFGIPFGQITVPTYDTFFTPNSDRAPLFASWAQQFGGKSPHPRQLREAILQDIEGGDNFKRNFIVFVVTHLIAPTAKANDCTWKVVKATEDLSIVKNMNWAQYLIDSLVSSIEKYKQKSSMANIGGCTLLLQVFLLSCHNIIRSLLLQLTNSKKFIRSNYTLTDFG